MLKAKPCDFASFIFFLFILPLWMGLLWPHTRVPWGWHSWPPGLPASFLWVLSAHSKMFNSIPGFNWPDACSISWTSCDTKMSPDIARCPQDDYIPSSGELLLMSSHSVALSTCCLPEARSCFPCVARDPTTWGEVKKHSKVVHLGKTTSRDKAKWKGHFWRQEWQQILGSGSRSKPPSIQLSTSPSLFHPLYVPPLILPVSPDIGPTEASCGRKSHHDALHSTVWWLPESQPGHHSTGLQRTSEL